ncbi:MAG: hypothetical protein KKA60_07710 [Proteobacteria bacterium]|nr:hypothetical protein [Pseudomonadota bacterium]
MAEKTQYQCGLCGRTRELGPGDTVPVCCERTMSPLPMCRTAPSAEHHRLENEDEPCDDARAVPNAPRKP